MGEYYFSTDAYGRNAYNINRIQLHNLKVDLKKGIREFDNTREDFNTKLMYCPWKAGERRGERPKEDTDEEKREHLAGALARPQQRQLYKIGWDIFDHTYKETIDKLESLEGELHEQLHLNKRLAEVEKSTGTSSSQKRERNGEKKGKNGSTKACKTCGRKHKGECYGKDWTPGKKKKTKHEFSKKETKMLKSMLSLKINEGSDSDSEKPEWTKGLSKAEQMFVVNEWRHDQDLDSDDDVDPSQIGVDELKAYKRKAKKAAKKFTW